MSIHLEIFADLELRPEIDFFPSSHYTFRGGRLPNCMFGTRGAKIVAKEVKG